MEMEMNGVQTCSSVLVVEKNIATDNENIAILENEITGCRNTESLKNLLHLFNFVGEFGEGGMGGAIVHLVIDIIDLSIRSIVSMIIKRRHHHNRTNRRDNADKGEAHDEAQQRTRGRSRNNTIRGIVTIVVIKK